MGCTAPIKSIQQVAQPSCKDSAHHAKPFPRHTCESAWFHVFCASEVATRPARQSPRSLDSTSGVIFLARRMCMSASLSPDACACPTVTASTAVPIDARHRRRGRNVTTHFKVITVSTKGTIPLFGCQARAATRSQRGHPRRTPANKAPDRPAAQPRGQLRHCPFQRRRYHSSKAPRGAAKALAGATSAWRGCSMTQCEQRVRRLRSNAKVGDRVRATLRVAV